MAAFRTGQPVKVVRAADAPDDDPAIVSFLTERLGQTGVVEDMASPDEHQYCILVRFPEPDGDGDYRLSVAAYELEPA
jgi:hypothetical protein